MKKEFIPYKQALALKELGFDEPCFCIYNREKVLRFNNLNNSNDRNRGVKLTANNGRYPAPLYQQVFRWFREKHNLDSHIKKDWTDGVLYGHEAIIECQDGFIDVGTFDYEEAELECIKRLIKILKNGK